MARMRTAGSALSDCSCCSRVSLTWHRMRAGQGTTCVQVWAPHAAAGLSTTQPEYDCSLRRLPHHADSGRATLQRAACCVLLAARYSLLATRDSLLTVSLPRTSLIESGRIFSRSRSSVAAARMRLLSSRACSRVCACACVCMCVQALIARTDTAPRCTANDHVRSYNLAPFGERR